MVSIDDLTIDIDIDVSGLTQLDVLSTKLMQVHAAQQMVDENMVIDIDSRMDGRLSSLMAGGGAQTATAVADGSGVPRGGMERLNLNMSQFYDILASLIPVLLNFVMALPAAITGMLTLAGAAVSAAVALGTIGALGLMGVAASRDGSLSEGFESILEELKSAFMDSILPVAREFEGIALDGIAGLKQLFDDLRPVLSSFTMLNDEARAFGGYLLDNIPALMGVFRDLTESFSPLLSQFGQWLEGANLIEGFVDATEEATPALMFIGSTLIQILPALVEFSQGFLMVTGAIMGVIGAVSWFMDLFPGLLTGLGIFIGTVLTVISAIATWTAVQMTLSTMVVPAFLSSMASSVMSLNAYITSMLAAIGVTGTFATVLKATGVGILLAGIGMLVSKFDGFNSNVQEATRSLKEFGDVQSSIGDSGMGAYGVNWEGIDRGSQTSVTNNDVTVNNHGGESRRTDKDVDKAFFISRGMS